MRGPADWPSGGDLTAWVGRDLIAWTGVEMPGPLMGNEPGLAARASSVARRLAAIPGQRPVPAEQDVREAFRGFPAGPVPLQLTTHLDHASRLAAGQGDAVQPGLVRLGRRPADGVGHRVDLIPLAHR